MLCPSSDRRFVPFATGSGRQQALPCLLCPDSDQIPHRIEMTRLCHLPT